MNQFRLVMDSPVGNEATVADVPHGLTIAQALGDNPTHSAEVRMGGHVIPRERWAHIKPKPGMPVEVTVYPQGGNGGKWIRLVAMVALTIVSAGAASGWFVGGGYFAAGSASAMALSAGIMLVGQLAITPMIGQPRMIGEAA